MSLAVRCHPLVCWASAYGLPACKEGPTKLTNNWNKWKLPTWPMHQPRDCRESLKSSPTGRFTSVTCSELFPAKWQPRSLCVASALRKYQLTGAFPRHTFWSTPAVGLNSDSDNLPSTTSPNPCRDAETIAPHVSILFLSTVAKSSLYAFLPSSSLATKDHCTAGNGSTTEDFPLCGSMPATWLQLPVHVDSSRVRHTRRVIPIDVT